MKTFQEQATIRERAEIAYNVAHCYFVDAAEAYIAASRKINKKLHLLKPYHRWFKPEWMSNAQFYLQRVDVQPDGVIVVVEASDGDTEHITIDASLVEKYHRGECTEAYFDSVYDDIIKADNAAEEDKKLAAAKAEYEQFQKLKEKFEAK